MSRRCDFSKRLSIDLWHWKCLFRSVKYQFSYNQTMEFFKFAVKKIKISSRFIENSKMADNSGNFMFSPSGHFFHKFPQSTHVQRGCRPFTLMCMCVRITWLTQKTIHNSCNFRIAILLSDSMCFVCSCSDSIATPALRNHVLSSRFVCSIEWSVHFCGHIEINSRCCPVLSSKFHWIA